ncbi:putative phage baseplate assembly domain protein [Clostridioides difficile DA00196]|nr:putative phage baseplate assembly domain protein [Clostridioides difficile DA00196]
MQLREYLKKHIKMKCETAGPIFELGKLIPIEYIDGLETAELTEI